MQTTTTRLSLALILCLTVLVVNVKGLAPKNEAAGDNDDDAPSKPTNAKGDHHLGTAAASKDHPKMPSEQEIQTKTNRLTAYCKKHKSSQKGNGVGGKKRGNNNAGQGAAAGHVGGAAGAGPGGDPVQSCCNALGNKNANQIRQSFKKLVEKMKSMHGGQKPGGADGSGNAGGGKKHEKKEEEKQRRKRELEPEDEEGSDDDAKLPPKHNGPPGKGGGATSGKKMGAAGANGGAAGGPGGGPPPHGKPDPMFACFQVECSSNTQCVAKKPPPMGMMHGQGGQGGGPPGAHGGNMGGQTKTAAGAANANKHPKQNDAKNAHVKKAAQDDGGDDE